MKARGRLVVIISLFFASFPQLGTGQEIPLQASPNNAFLSPENPRNADDVLAFSEVWRVLGPFQVGTRGRTRPRHKYHIVVDSLFQRLAGEQIR